MVWNCTLAALLVCTGALAGEALTDKVTMNLWPGKAPGSLGETPADTPVVQAFVPEQGKATGASIVVCPGGGYGGLARHEGPVIGEWLAKNGVTAFVLRYRLGPKYHHPVELGDAQRAIRFVRSHAAEWKLDPQRIGILGFSAGGHLASTAATHFTDGDSKSEDLVERVASRPDVQILIYPVITMGPGGHGGSKNNLLGPNPPQDLVDLLSNEKQVTAKTPPAFLVHSTKDNGVPVSNSDKYAEALKTAGIPYEYVRGEIGGHGFGLTKDWDAKCIEWLRKQKF
ncbi:MAG TPA: alpha/beta hydrolase [Planctomycetota bacterium]|jgi:acetyl esterase/lipase